jgi:hypothetical protein
VHHKHMKHTQKYEDGVGIVEVIAALGLSIIVLTSLVSLSLFTVRSSLQSKLLLEGTKLANKQLELVRAARDSATYWENGSDGFLNQVIPCVPGSPCHMDSSTLLVDGSSDIIDPGTAEEIEILFTASDPNDGGNLVTTDEEVRISVIVRWTVAGDNKYARLYTDLTNWANK